MAVGTFRKRGKAGIYIYRAWLPVRERGQVVQKRIERSTRTSKRSEAEEVARKIDAEYFGAARLSRESDGSDTTFHDAVKLYLQNNPDSGEDYYLVPIVEEIGDMTLDEVTQSVVQNVAEKLKGHCKANTKARHVFDPINAVYNNAAQAGFCPLRKFKKPKGWNRHKRVMSPPDSWYAAVMPHLNVRFYALMVFLATHGRRVSDATQRKPDDINTEVWPWTIDLDYDEKVGAPVRLELAEHAIDAIDAMPGWREREYLFGTRSRHNVKRAVKRACDKAGVPFYGSHAWGRHKANRNWLAKGGSIKGTMEAFGWKSPRMPLLHYGHEEFSEITERVHRVGSEWLDNLQLQPYQGDEGAADSAGGRNRGRPEQPEPKKRAKSAG